MIIARILMKSNHFSCIFLTDFKNKRAKTMYRPIDVYSVQVVHLKRNIHAKSKKHTSKKIRNALRKQLAYVKRDLRYLEQFMNEGYAMTGKDINLYLTIIRLYEWQQYILHSYRNRICVK